MCIDILNMLDSENPDIVVIEMTSVSRNVATQRMLDMILGVVYSWCITHNCDYNMYRPTEWRALVSSEPKGRKRAELKQWSINKVKELYGIETDDDNISDAILIGLAFMNKWEKMVK